MKMVRLSRYYSLYTSKLIITPTFQIAQRFSFEFIIVFRTQKVVAFGPLFVRTIFYLINMVITSLNLVINRPYDYQPSIEI